MTSTPKKALIEMLTAFRKDGTAFHQTNATGGTFTSRDHPGKAAHWKIIGDRLLIENDAIGHISHYGEARDFALSRMKVVSHDVVNFKQHPADQMIADLYCAANMFKYLYHLSEVDNHDYASMKTKSSVINADGSWKR